MTEQQMIEKTAALLGLSSHQVKSTIALLDDDNTVPFIARYRKEATGSLNEDQIRDVQERMKYLRNLNERKETVLKSIADQGKLTPELEEKIQAAEKLTEVEDLYLPYKPKRRTRATIAKEKGLEPLADMILTEELTSGDVLTLAADFIDEEKGVSDADAALAGARDIVAEVVSENADIRKTIREYTQQNGHLASATADEALAANYEMYQSFSEPIKTIPAYRILAINRGEREGALKVTVDVDVEVMNSMIEKACIHNSNSIFTDEYKTAIADSYGRLIAPSIQREMRRILTDRADEHAIDIFARNLRALLMTPPLKGKVMLGIDPAYRTGCKIAAIDTTGKYLAGTTIYPHAPKNQWDEAKSIIKEFIQIHGAEVIAIGNGTASRETEQLVAETLGEIDAKVAYTIVNEAGASVYSASPVAKQEFPDLEAAQRGNISIARRLMDPLSELVKIDPKSIGVGLYQHDVDQTHLSESLDSVVESCVNAVGVDLNTASASLLKYVAGINSRVAENIVQYREEKGKFSSREELKAVKGLGANAFVQASGFLRIPDSDTFFDSTAVHPESYTAAEKLISQLQLSIEDVKTNGSVVRSQLKSTKETLVHLAEICECGPETLQDIIDSLEKPNRDPRDDSPEVILRNDVLKMEDLTEGMILKGTVRNVVDFGAFVDIGVKQDGLVHLSQMARKFVKNPLDIVKVGDIVEVKVMKIDIERGRIGLSMLVD